MSDFPRFDYTMGEVRRAGEALAGTLVWTKDTEEQIRRVFHVANNFRDSHAYPMRAVRYDLSGKVRKARISGGVTVARLKRMPSIRRKLRALSTNLNQIQDLAGCRCIVPTMEDASALIAEMRVRARHELVREDFYIVEPKPDGYRSHHMVFKFRGDGTESINNGRRVEVQIRTRLQHSWATAVEAVGLFRREDFKAGQGDKAWLRLFGLMSREFMLEEGCKVGDQGDCRKEVAALEQDLAALKLLEDLRQGVKVTETYRFDPANRPDYFLIRYDRKTNAVTVAGHWGPRDAMLSYDRVEDTDPASNNNEFNSVLVEVDEVENLRSAYPNYFGDVALFQSRLAALCGVSREAYNLVAQPRVPPSRERPDLSWLRSYRRWPEER